MIYERDDKTFFLPTDPEFQKGLGQLFSCSAEFKKCCEKYKKGKRCKKCPGNKK